VDTFASMAEFVEGLWARQPNAPAFHVSGKIHTRGDVARSAREAARQWLAAGFSPGNPIGIIGEGGPAVARAILAAFRAGLAPLLLDPRLTSAEARAVIDRARPVAFARCAGANLTTPVSGPVYDFDADGRTTLPVAGADVSLPAAAGDPHSTALLLVTSGTSGHPRIVALSAHNIFSNLRSGYHFQACGPDDVVLSLLPLTHAFELVTGVIGPLHAEASVAFPESRNPRQLLRLVQSAGVTRVNVVPAALHMIVEELNGSMLGRVIGRRLCRQLRWIACGGAAPSRAVIDRLVACGAPLWVGYGLTEASPTVTVGPAADVPAGSCGRALPDVELRIESETGELLVRGPNVMREYFNDPDATFAVFTNGWLRTGDLARIDDRGFVYILGRRRDLIVTGAGLKILPEDVERAYDSPLFQERCAFGAPHHTGGESPWIAVVPADNTTSDDALEREFRRLSAGADGRRADRMVVSRTVLPRTRTLKVRRDLVRHAALEQAKSQKPEEGARHAAIS
jgi:long-subunit acyl-CoA synthetase (AMP-forming)